MKKQERKQIFDTWERAAWLPPPEETIEKWAEKNIILPRGVSSITGPLSFDLTPFIREPLRAVIDPEVEEIILCFSSQVCKTTFLIVIMLYFMKNDPWNMLHIMPTDDQALELKIERYKPIIMNSPAIRDLLTGERGEFAGDGIRLNDCTLSFGGAYSPSALASRPARVAAADEINKWPPWSGTEADPIELLGERLKTFHDAKYLKCSTPTVKDGPISVELASSTDERYHVPCPLCGRYQVLVFGDGHPNSPGIKWPEDVRDPDLIDDENLAWYECQYCHGVIEEGTKREMISAGVWVPRGMTVSGSGEVIGRPPIRRKVGYHIWAGYSLWPKANWSKIAANFLRWKDTPQKLMNFRNSWLAETWEVTVNELKAFHVRKRRSEYWIGEIPENADTIVFGVDVQSRDGQTYHFYVARAWGSGGKSWLVRYGVTSGWPSLKSIIFETEYKTPSGKPLTKIRPVVDSGYTAAEVYAWCWENEGIAYKGDSRGRRHINLTEIPRDPESDEKIELAVVNPNYYKTELHRLIKQEDKWFLPREVDEEYFDHMVAEQLIRKVDNKTGRQYTDWKLKSDGLPNHYFDCEVMALVAADLAELIYRQGAQPEVKKEIEPSKRETKPSSANPNQIHREIVRIFS